VGEPAAHHARLEPEVEPGGHDRVVHAGHHDDLIDERVVRAAPAAQLLAQHAFLRLAQVLDDQDLEIGPVGPGRLGPVDVAALAGVVIGAQVPGLAAPVGIGGQRPVDLAR
jgi:hypothetical protein